MKTGEKMVRGGAALFSGVGLYFLSGIAMNESATPEETYSAEAADIAACANILEDERTTTDTFPANCEALREKILYTKSTIEHIANGVSTKTVQYTLPRRAAVTGILPDMNAIRKTYDEDRRIKNIARPIISVVAGVGVYQLTKKLYS